MAIPTKPIPLKGIIDSDIQILSKTIKLPAELMHDILSLMWNISQTAKTWIKNVYLHTN